MEKLPNTKESIFNQLWEESLDQFDATDEIDDWHEKLDPEHRFAAVLGSLNNQVCNGGFYHWHTVGYGVYVYEAVGYLRDVGTDSSNRMCDILKRYTKAIIPKVVMEFGWGAHDESPESYEDHYGREEYRESVEDAMFTALEGCDEDFNKINENLLEDIEAFLQAKKVKENV